LWLGPSAKSNAVVTFPIAALSGDRRDAALALANFDLC